MRKIFPLLLATLFSNFVFANNVQISNVSVNGNNISFTISWENSWNTTNNTDPNYPNNWDAVWIFIKYQRGDNIWRHAPLSTLSADHSATGGILQVDAVADGVGVFIRRSNPGAGNISATTITLRLGTLQGAGTPNFRVFGIEMVHCPTGAFWIGDGNDASFGDSFKLQQINGTTQSNGIPANGLYPGSPFVPNTFPMGFWGSYIMKYEASYQQYADFLNTLTYDQQLSRTNVSPDSPIGVRVIEYVENGVSIGTTKTIEIITSGINNTIPAIYGCDFTDDNNFNDINDGQNIALEGISVMDFLAYLDWSGLRPMTEMEFEKACRGTKNAVKNEYSWGTTDLSCRQRVIVSQGITFQQLSNWGEASEAAPGTAVNGRCFCGVNITIDNPGDGTGRNGIFATSATGRQSSGAGFYGAMDLSGNSYEFCVSLTFIGHSIVYSGNHGDGFLTNSGNPDVTLWPEFDVSNKIQIHYKGGVWFGTNPDLPKTSNRPLGVTPIQRKAGFGIRGVRTYY
jgi:formylglycine-generating enzyme required for sulfatase activity